MFHWEFGLEVFRDGNVTTWRKRDENVTEKTSDTINKINMSYYLQHPSEAWGEIFAGKSLEAQEGRESYCTVGIPKMLYSRQSRIQSSWEKSNIDFV